MAVARHMGRRSKGREENPKIRRRTPSSPGRRSGGYRLASAKEVLDCNRLPSTLTPKDQGVTCEERAGSFPVSGFLASKLPRLFLVRQLLPGLSHQEQVAAGLPDVSRSLHFHVLFIHVVTVTVHESRVISVQVGVEVRISFLGTAVDVSEAHWRKCAPCRGGADRRAPDSAMCLISTCAITVGFAPMLSLCSQGEPVEWLSSERDSSAFRIGNGSRPQIGQGLK
jgi:hypothetical protein